MKKKRLKQRFSKGEFKKLFSIMKLGFFFLLLSTNLTWAIQTYAQITTFNLDLKNVALEEVFDAVRDQSEFEFFFNNDQVNTSEKVNVKVKNAGIDAVLNQALTDVYEYKIKDRYILINKKKEILPAVSPQPQQQSKQTIMGNVTDKDGISIIGASILQKGTTNGTVSDIDGNFTISIPAGSILRVSYIGYITQEIEIGSRTKLHITLVEDTKSLNEVVVVGYGTMNRRNLSTAISTVKTENISKGAISNMSQMLMGRAAGLTANLQSPQPGGDVSLSIRGSGTPIIIVDGVMMPSSSLEVGTGSTEMVQGIKRGGLAGLNPNDIESIEILKDASAAIYGIGAANGVVLITTKNGSEGKLNITVESNNSMIKNYPYLKPLNAQEYMNMANVFNKENIY